VLGVTTLQMGSFNSDLVILARFDRIVDRYVVGADGKFTLWARVVLEHYFQSGESKTSLTA